MAYGFGFENGHGELWNENGIWYENGLECYEACWTSCGVVVWNGLYELECMGLLFNENVWNLNIWK